MNTEMKQNASQMNNVSGLSRVRGWLANIRYVAEK